MTNLLAYHYAILVVLLLFLIVQNVRFRRVRKNLRSEVADVKREHRFLLQAATNRLAIQHDDDLRTLIARHNDAMKDLRERHQREIKVRVTRAVELTIEAMTTLLIFGTVASPKEKLDPNTKIDPLDGILAKMFSSQGGGGAPGDEKSPTAA